MLPNRCDSQFWWLTVFGKRSQKKKKTPTKLCCTPKWTLHDSSELLMNPEKWITSLLGGSDSLAFKNLLLTFWSLAVLSGPFQTHDLEALFIPHTVHPTRWNIVETCIHHPTFTPWWGKRNQWLFFAAMQHKGAPELLQEAGLLGGKKVKLQLHNVKESYMLSYNVNVFSMLSAWRL